MHSINHWKKTTQIPVNRIAHSYNGILYLNKKEPHSATCSHMDELHKYNVEWIKQTQNNTYHVIPFVRVQKHVKVEC